MKVYQDSYEWRRMLNKRDAIRAHVDLYNKQVTDAQYAVYFAYGWENWQIFRLSIKGLSVGSKLVCLQGRWDNCDRSDPNERIRINNYLGALLRGGFEEARPMFDKMRAGDL